MSAHERSNELVIPAPPVEFSADAPPALPRCAGLPLTLEWQGGADGRLRLLDQTRLPAEVTFVDCGDAETVREAIRSLRVRGAPAIGIAAAYGLCLATRDAQSQSADRFATRLAEAESRLASARPTAVNLFWALRRVRDVGVGALPGGPVAAWRAMLAEAHRMACDDARACRRIGEFGADLIPDGGGVLTHCNAGALATVAYGTALAAMYVAHERGKRFRVYADETRPLWQGARLTVYELMAAGLDVVLICDNMAASLMRGGKIQAAIVGADRIAANGDTANKIGTYGAAVLAWHHGIPFHVAAPLSTFDRTLAGGASIPIEQRSAEEVSAPGGLRIAPAGAACENPAFDVTPAMLIDTIVTDAGLIRPVTAANVAAILASGAA